MTEVIYNYDGIIYDYDVNNLFSYRVFAIIVLGFRDCCTLVIETIFSDLK